MSFFGRVTVLELLLGVAFATALVAFLQGITSGLVFEPITEGGHHTSSWGSLTLAIDGRAFDFSFVLISAVTLVLLALVSVPLIRRSEAELWDERELRDCPYCLSEIPAAASVCSYCTRDVS